VAEATPFYLEAALALGEGLLDRARSSLVHALANGHRRLGKVDKAVSLFRRVLEVEPENMIARVEFAKLLEGVGQLGEAFDVLKVLVADSSGSTAELERLATLALGAGKLEDAVRLLKRAADRHPEDLALTRALEATQARLRDAMIRSLAGSREPERQLELAGLYAEHGSQNDAIRVLRTLGKLEGDTPELSFLRFSADHFARIGREDKAEAALRKVGQALNYAPGSEPYKDLVYRIGGLYEQAGDRRSARRVLLEVFVLDPAFRDVSTKLEILSQDVGSGAAVDERMLEMVDVGAPLGTIFDAMQGVGLTLDPKLLSGGRSSSVVMKVPKGTL
jgi:tetratricopeptide (TPR) repeat protein